MNKKTIALLSLMLACMIPGFSQRTITKTNIFMGPFFKTIYTIQEIKVGPRFTINTSVKTRPPSRYRFGNLGFTVDGSTYDPFAGGMKMSGIGNVTEFRIYGKEKGAFNGFYHGPYVSYMHYKIYSEPYRAEFEDANGNIEYADLSQEIKINVTNVGYMFGVQKMMLNNHLCIDWTILGIGFGMLGVKGSIVATNYDTEFDLRNYANTASDGEFGFERFLNFSKTTGRDYVDLGLKIPMVYWRMGLAIGFGY